MSDQNYNVKILQSNKKNIKYIVHLADIHIHRCEREDEYRKVFNNLITDFKQQNLNNSNCVIVVCGDVLHDKTNLSPLSVSLTKLFFSLLTSIADCIVISGNHDMALNNTELNSLSCIIDEYLKTKNDIYLLIDEGLYEYNNIIFGHTLLGDKPKIYKCNIKTDKIKCALYHGIIKTSQDESGYIYGNGCDSKQYLNISDFNTYDLTLLGDIHKHSFLNPTMAYAGSLVQQHCDESLNKGCIVWTLNKKITGIFRKINNEYGKIKIKIDEDGKSNYDISKIPKIIDINIECKSMNIKHIDEIYKQMETQNITMVKQHDTFIGNTKINTTINVNGKSQDLILLKSKDDAIDLLINVVKEKNNVSDTIVEDLKNIITNTLQDYNFYGGSQKKKIKLQQIKFNNMIVYGEDNILNFDKFAKIVGINDINSSGKSSLIDIILHSTFGDSSRGHNYDIININCTSCSTEIIIDVNNVKYKICRTITRNSKDKTKHNVKEEVIFYENDKNISGKSKIETEDIIYDKICTIDDFILSCIVTQKSLYQGKCIGFVEATSKDRKEILCKIARLDVYKYIYEKCKFLNNCNTSYINKIKGKLLNYEMTYKNKKTDHFTENISKISAIFDEQTTQITTKIKELNDLLENKYNERETLQKNITQKETILKSTQEKINNYDVIEDMTKYENIDKKILDIKNKIEIKNKEKNGYEIELKNSNNKMEKYGDISDIQNKFNINKTKHINLLNKTIKEKRKLLWIDSSFNYNDYDINNNDKEAREYIIDIDNLQNILNNIKNEIILLTNICENKIEQFDTKILDNFREKNKLKNQSNDKMIDNKNKIEGYNNKLKLLDNHEYDENCKFCMKNSLTCDKIYCENNIINLANDNDVLNKTIKKLDTYLTKHANIEKLYSLYIEKITEQNDCKNKLIILEKDVMLNNNLLSQKQAKLKQCVLMKENFAKYLNNSNIEKEIIDLENKIDKIQDSCCEEIKEINILQKKCTEIENKLKISNADLKLLNDDHNALKSLEQEYTQNKKDREIYFNNISEEKNLKQICSVYNDNMIKIMNDIDICTTEKTKHNETLNNLIHRQKNLTELLDEYKIAENLGYNYSILLNLLENNGIVDSIITNNLLPRLEEIANNLFDKFNSRNIKIFYEKSTAKKEKDIVIRTINNVNISRDGGYQTYLNNIVFRIALSQLNGYMHTNFMIIDEILDSVDHNNKQNINKLVDYMRIINDWVLIISHDDSIKDKYESILTIQDHGIDGKQIIC